MTTPSNGSDQQQGSGDTGQDTGSGSAGSGELNIDYGGQTTGEAPTTLKMGEPVTVTYAASVEKATVTVDDDDPNTEAWTKQFKFGPAGQEEITAEVTQGEAPDDRKVTVKVPEWPGDAEKLTIDWGGEATADSSADSQNPDGQDQDSGTGSQPGSEGQAAPTEITKDKPEVVAVYANSVTKATITVDDDKPETQAFSKALKFSPAAPEEPGEGETPPEGEEPPAEEPPAEEPPAEEPPAEEPPAEEPPAEEQPPAEEPPAEEPPAEEQPAEGEQPPAEEAPADGQQPEQGATA